MAANKLKGTSSEAPRYTLDQYRKMGVSSFLPRSVLYRLVQESFARIQDQEKLIAALQIPKCA